MKATRSRETQVVRCIQGHYEATEVPFGMIYKWYPGCVVVKCHCGERPTLSPSATTCGECGADHASVALEAQGNERLEDEDLRPWHYAEDREDLSLPC